MAKDLGIEVVCLVRGVMDVVLGSLVEEEAVVIDLLLAPVQPPENAYVDAVLVVDELAKSKREPILYREGWWEVIKEGNR